MLSKNRNLHKDLNKHSLSVGEGGEGDSMNEYPLTHFRLIEITSFCQILVSINQPCFAYFAAGSPNVNGCVLLT